MNIISIIKKNYAIIGILLIGAILRLYKLDFQSVWLDELHTMKEADPKFSFTEVYSNIMAHEQTPPLYFYTVNLLFKTFGYTPFVVRFYSAIIGIFGIYFTYLLGKEMFTKRVGIITAALISVNYFQLFYSQEARPYVFLYLLSILSFYYLIRYLKDNAIKNALVHGVIAGLMISFHFFGLFVLFSQYVLLLIFLILSQEKKKFFLGAAVSGAVTFILFIPTIKVFKMVSELKEFWIPQPPLDIYTNYFRYFFGNSELVLSLVGFLVVIYFIRLLKEKDTPITYDAIIENKNVFNFIILSVWIVISILIPLIRSYLSIPMLQPRYFTAVLPAVIILIAVAINQFNNKTIQIGLISMFIIFSITDIVVVKKYYTAAHKDQFREASQFIIDNNKTNEPVATSWIWQFSYFLKNDKINMNLVDKNLEGCINEMIQNPSIIKSFWYVDAHESRRYNLSPTAQKFVDDNFIVDKSIDLYDAYAKHYAIALPVPADISKCHPLKTKYGQTINYWIENFETKEGEIIIKGWGYLEGIEATNSSIHLILISEIESYKFQTQQIRREDITKFVKNEFNLDNSGFSSTFKLNNIKKGKYTIGIIIKNSSKNKEGLVVTDKTFSKQ